MADDALTVPDRKRPGSRPRLTGEDMALIHRLHSSGRKLTEIARIVSTPDRVISPETVGQWIRRAKQPHEALHMALAAGRFERLEEWALASKRGARDGRHAPAKDWLIASGTIRNDQSPALVVLIGSGTVDADTLPSLPRRD